MRFLAALGGNLALAFLVLALAAVPLLTHPATPLPREWNPVLPLDMAEPLTPVTPFKLAASQRGASCSAAINSGDVRFVALDDFEISDVCHIRDRVRLDRVGSAALAPVETRCATALRLALWERHVLQPLAEAHLGTSVTRILHQSSYNCRPIRTPSGDGQRMSTHATASAIDVRGFTLGDGREIVLTSGWNSADYGRFLRAVRNGACDWFTTVLGPDFNILHADHFHLQAVGRGPCR
ncbi:MAG: extensin family protein [Pseudomonadota bacterium]